MDGIDISQWFVLVVDDRDECREITADTLWFHGIRPIQAKDGYEALRLMEHIMPTFVLTELATPVIDGWELRESMQNFAHLAHIPVIALTVPDLHTDRTKVIAAGFAGYIAKPVNTRTLVTDLATIVLPAIWRDQEMVYTHKH